MEHVAACLRGSQIGDLGRFEFVNVQSAGQDMLKEGRELRALTVKLHDDFVAGMAGLAAEAMEAADETELEDIKGRVDGLKGMFQQYIDIVIGVAAHVHALLQSEVWKAAKPSAEGTAQQLTDAFFTGLEGLLPGLRSLLVKLDPASAAALSAPVVAMEAVVKGLHRRASIMLRDYEIDAKQREDPDFARKALNADPALMAKRVCRSQQTAVSPTWRTRSRAEASSDPTIPRQ